MPKPITLTSGKTAIVDDADFDRANRISWYAARRSNKWYAAHMDTDETGKHIIILLHRWLVGATPDIEVDHKNGDGLDCRKDNLRVCSHAENMRNMKRHRDNSSGYKGVSWHSQTKQWRAKICLNYKTYHLGLFDDPIDAALAYDKASKSLHGVFARTNF